MSPTIFFAISVSLWVQAGAGFTVPSPLTSGFFHLTEFELDRSRASENRHRHAQAALLVVHVFHRTLEIGERAFLDAHHLAVLEQHRGLGLLHALAHLLHDRLDFLLGNRGGLGRRAADEAGHLVGVLHQVPGVVVHLHLDEHVAGEELALRHVLLAALHLDDLLHRHEDLAELVGPAGAIDPVLERTLHRLLEAGVGVHDVPALAAHVFFQLRITSYRTHSSVLSLIHKKTAITTTKANTAAVVCIVSFRVGQTTFFTSATDSAANSPNSRPGVLNQATAAPASSPATTASTRSTSALSASQ